MQWVNYEMYFLSSYVLYFYVAICFFHNFFAKHMYFLANNKCKMCSGFKLKIKLFCGLGTRTGWGTAVFSSKWGKEEKKNAWKSRLKIHNCTKILYSPKHTEQQRSSQYHCRHGTEWELCSARPVARAPKSSAKLPNLFSKKWGYLTG